MSDKFVESLKKKSSKKNSLLRVAIGNSARGRVKDCMKALSTQKGFFEKNIRILKIKIRQLNEKLNEKMQLIEQLNKELDAETRKYDMLEGLILKKETLQSEVNALKDQFNTLKHTIRQQHIME